MKPLAERLGFLVGVSAGVSFDQQNHPSPPYLLDLIILRVIRSTGRDGRGGFKNRANSIWFRVRVGSGVVDSTRNSGGERELYARWSLSVVCLVNAACDITRTQSSRARIRCFYAILYHH
jgi:hypothetical protein